VLHGVFSRNGTPRNGPGGGRPLLAYGRGRARGGQALQLRLQSGQPLDGRIDQLQRRELAFADELRQADGIGPAQPCPTRHLRGASSCAEPDMRVTDSRRSSRSVARRVGNRHGAVPRHPDVIGREWGDGEGDPAATPMPWVAMARRTKCRPLPGPTRLMPSAARAATHASPMHDQGLTTLGVGWRARVSAAVVTGSRRSSSRTCCSSGSTSGAQQAAVDQRADDRGGFRPSRPIAGPARGSWKSSDVDGRSGSQRPRLTEGSARCRRCGRLDDQDLRAGEFGGEFAGSHRREADSGRVVGPRLQEERGGLAGQPGA